MMRQFSLLEMTFAMPSSENQSRTPWMPPRAKELYQPMLSIFDQDTIDIITVEDENTTGMSDKPRIDNGVTLDSTFKVFTQSTGVTDKPVASSGGSYGFGKAAFFQMSPLRTIFVYSKTPDQEENFA